MRIRNRWYWAGWWFSLVVSRLFFRFRIVHTERRIATGPVIVAMNHQSYLDPPLAGLASGREVFFLAR